MSTVTCAAAVADKTAVTIQKKTKIKGLFSQNKDPPK